MLFSEIIGQESLKTHLIQTVQSGRIPHAQLFVGQEGSGSLPMAIAYAQYILCKNSDQENLDGIASCNLKFNSLSHPDLHFVYPTVTTDDVKSKPKSIDFIKDWNSFVLDNPYGSLFDWYQKLGVSNKQGEIRVDDAQEILKTLALKSYEGGYKIIIGWMIDKMNTAAANKLLKILEEPPEKTLFIFITENEEDIIQTIRSRCQVLYFNFLSEQDIALKLIQQKLCTDDRAYQIAKQAQGNFNKALELINEEKNEFHFEAQFVQWVRAAFRAKGNPTVILDLIEWSQNVAAWGRETQKKFLQFCIEMFRQALMLNYEIPDLVYLKPNVEKFKMENFAPFVNGNNIEAIFKELSDAIYHIERNGNSKIILTDLSIKLTRLIHKK